MTGGFKHSQCCKHYHGRFGPNGKAVRTCDAGVNFDEMLAGRKPIGNMPCIRDPGAPSCPKADYPTPEEAAAIDAAIEASVQRSFKVAAEVVKASKRKPGSGTIPCPACGKGTVHYSVSSYNRHIWAKCTTPECVSFME